MSKKATYYNPGYLPIDSVGPSEMDLGIDGPGGDKFGAEDVLLDTATLDGILAGLTTLQQAINVLDDHTHAIGAHTHTASDVSIVDTGDYFTSTNVEDALAEKGQYINQDVKNSASPTFQKILTNAIKQLSAAGFKFENETGTVIANILLAKWLLGSDAIASERLHILGNLLTQTPGIDEVQYLVDKDENIQILFNTGVNAQNAIKQGVFGVGVSSNDPSAVVEFASTDKGFVGPRGTSAQRLAIPSPTEGLEFYDLTTHQKMMWNGSSWVILG